MSKPPNKALLGCLTLLTTYSSANLGYISAAEVSVDPDNTPNDNTLDPAVTQQSDATETSGEALNAQRIMPDNEVQPAFASQSIAVSGGGTDELTPTEQEDTRATRLENLVSTVSRDVSARNSLLNADRSTEVGDSNTLIETVVTAPAEQTINELRDEDSVQESEQNSSRVQADGLPSEDAITPDVVEDVAVSQSDIKETIVAARIVESESDSVTEIAQLPLEPPIVTPSPQDQEVIEQLLDGVPASTNIPTPYRSSPAITISNPSGFGADNFTGFVGVGYQERTRFGNKDDGGLVVGIGLGDARENIGVQLSYTVASFGGSRDFGTGGFNAKLHKRLADDWSVALGWEGFATTGFVDFEDSIYGSVSHLIRTRDSITKPFSRVALTAGVGSGRFRTEDDVFDDRDSVGVFGSMAVRVAEPVSAIVEWTGQDLAAGLSITPFRDVPIVLLPAVRDIAGAGDGGRFVMGAGFSFQF
ncbi:hypothetical protein [Leptolyngbya sp. Heron Island J]|uniref:hypothetical protein n=1 Tax=Leptolyngbya sp. Heron Island J TaxID=1385935 RepID=UPI000686681C|nr:hypothetical protein [Leptolyngbya sp. Heron Island J]